MKDETPSEYPKNAGQRESDGNAKPMVSIIIRTLNEERYVGGLLEGIRSQTFQDAEIINVDSGSTDRTPEIMKAYADKIIQIPPEDFTFGYSLNLGCQAASGEFLVMVSAHVLPVINAWLSNLVQPFDDPSVGLVYGRQRGYETTRIGEERDLRKTFGPTSKILVDEPFSHNGSAAIRRFLWLEEQFDESLPGLEDMDWTRKAQKKGYRAYYAANAPVYHIHEESLRRIYRRYRGEAVAYKRIFPSTTFSKSGLIKSVLVESARDFLYAIRTRKSPGKWLPVPAARIAHYLGVYHGTLHHRNAAAGVLKQIGLDSQEYQYLAVTGPGQHSLRTTKPLVVQADQALIKVAYVNVTCNDSGAPSAGGPNEGPDSRVNHLGGEFSGLVVSVGASVKSLKPGDKIVGRSRTDWASGGFHETQNNPSDALGAYAKYFAAPADSLLKIPSDIPLKHGMFIPAVTECLTRLNRLDVKTHRTACVFGAGSLGNICAQVLRSRGLRVVVVDPDPRRLSMLQKMDMDTLTHAGESQECDYLIEAGGPAEISAEARSSAHTVVCMSAEQMGKSIANNAQNWREASRLVSKGVIDLQDHIDTVLPLEEYAKAWRIHQNGERLNVLLNPNVELAAI